MSTIIDKSLILNEIKNHYSLKNDADFARFLGIKPQTLSSWHSRNTFDIDLLYSKCVNIDGNWLLTGDGNMLKSELRNDTIMPVQIKKGLPLIPLDAMAGFGNGDRQVHENEVTDYYEVPLFEKRGAKYLIPVAGNSMYPKYASGDLLACKPLTGLNFVQWGKPYVLDTEQGALVKRLFEDPNDEDLLICKSDNTDHYPPFHINKSEIYKVAIVVGVIRLE